MRSETWIEPYRHVIAPVEQYLYGSDGQRPGDPARAADAMIQAVDSPNPPLRLPLGSDAIGLWETKRAAVALPILRLSPRSARRLPTKGWRSDGSAGSSGRVAGRPCPILELLLWIRLSSFSSLFSVRTG